MAKTAFCYLAGCEQAEALVEVVAQSWLWLTTEAARDPVRVILESPTEVCFEWLSQVERVRQWPVGRAFGQTGQLTWQRADGLTHIILLTDREDTLPMPFVEAIPPGREIGETLTLTLAANTLIEDGSPEQIQLWGEYEEGVWRAGRLPDPIRYPVAGAQEGSRVMLHLRRYVEAGRLTDGTVDFVRYVDLSLA